MGEGARIKGMEKGARQENRSAMEGHFFWHKGPFCGFRLHVRHSLCKGTSTDWQGGKELYRIIL